MFASTRTIARSSVTVGLEVMQGAGVIGSGTFASTIDMPRSKP